MSAARELDEGMCFLQVGVDHHLLAITAAPHVSFNHVSFEMRSLNEYLCGTGRLIYKGIRPAWGPGRHALRDKCSDVWLEGMAQRLRTEGECGEMVADALAGVVPPVRPVPRMSVYVGMVGPPEEPGVIANWSDDEWLSAVQRYFDNDSKLTDLHVFVGGREQLVQQLAEAAQLTGERFNSGQFTAC